MPDRSPQGRCKNRCSKAFVPAATSQSCVRAAAPKNEMRTDYAGFCASGVHFPFRFFRLVHMPGCARSPINIDIGAVPGEGTRWGLVDFIHVNADATRLRTLAGEVTQIGYPSPVVSADCEDGSSLSIGDLRGYALLVALSAHTSDEDLASLSERAHAAGLRSLLVTPDMATAPAKGVCVANDKDAFEALSFYGGEKRDQSELLVDPAGSIRALWHPGLEPSWTNPNTLRYRAETLRNAPTVARATGAGHVH